MSEVKEVSRSEIWLRQKIIENLRKIVKDLTGQDITPNLEHPKDERHGDYSTNIAMTIFAKSKVKSQKSKVGTPMELAEKIADQFRVSREAGSSSARQSSRPKDDRPLAEKFKVIDIVEVVQPGFINFWLSKDYLTTLMIRIIRVEDAYGSSNSLENKRIMVEYAHPNTHKEMHIGHMRTLITGEAISRIFEDSGAKVFRANYQGDIGPHVAKAMFGLQELMRKRKLILYDIEKWTNKEKAHFLGEGYVVGNKRYEDGILKREIDNTNAFLYQKVLGDQVKSTFRKEEKDKLWSLYNKTRQWSLDYYDEFYGRFYTKFDKLFFESEMVLRGKDIVEKNLGRVFKRDQGAIVFKGESYGFHTRVFITKADYPTYEGKEMANAFEEYEIFPFDKKIHVVASEQSEYFKVVFKALELIDAEKFKDRQYHIPMGMVHLLDRKMSSRTGDILTVDSLIDRVKEKVNSLVDAGKIKKTGIEDVAEEVAIGAIKYSVLKVDTKQDVAFDIEKSVSLEGNSGPYLQYAFARTQSVLRKSEIRNPKHETNSNFSGKARSRFARQNTNVQKVSTKSDLVSSLGHLNFDIVSNFDIRAWNLELEPEEVSLLRTIYRFPEVVEDAADKFAPNIICNYLFDLAQKFNLFYQKHPILHPVILIRQMAEKNPIHQKRDSSPRAQNDNIREFRLALTAGVGQTLKNGLDLLGIKAPERM